MEMTFNQYIDNPMGKHNAVFSQRELFKQLYTEKFDKVFLREAGKINYALYIDKKRNRYIAHFKIPSETVNKFYYDAVILFYTNDAAITSSPNLQGYFVKFFSNDPAFVFTYLRVFLKNDLFFEDLKSKSSKLALNEDPKQKNPYEVPGYSKILYFAYIFMKSKNLFTKAIFESQARPYDKKILVNSVMHTDLKIADRQEAGERLRQQQAQEAKKEKREMENKRSQSIDSPSGNIKATRKTNTVGSVKQTGTVKTTKRSNRK